MLTNIMERITEISEDCEEKQINLLIIELHNLFLTNNLNIKNKKHDKNIKYLQEISRLSNEILSFFCSIDFKYDKYDTKLYDDVFTYTQIWSCDYIFFIENYSFLYEPKA